MKFTTNLIIKTPKKVKQDDLISNLKREIENRPRNTTFE
jgi:hypothetical protein